MPEEIGSTLKNLKNISETIYGDLKIYSGEWSNNESEKVSYFVSVAWSGWGKVCAARAATRLIGNSYKDSKIISHKSLSSDNINNVMGVYFKSGNSEIWGLQYHPDYEYWQMVNLSNERKDRMIKNKYFKNENDFQNHINYIKDEDKKLDFESRTCEIKNWLNHIKLN